MTGRCCWHGLSVNVSLFRFSGSILICCLHPFCEACHQGCCDITLEEYCFLIRATCPWELQDVSRHASWRCRPTQSTDPRLRLSLRCAGYVSDGCNVFRLQWLSLWPKKGEETAIYSAASFTGSQTMVHITLKSTWAPSRGTLGIFFLNVAVKVQNWNSQIIIFI